MTSMELSFPSYELTISNLLERSIYSWRRKSQAEGDQHFDLENDVTIQTIDNLFGNEFFRLHSISIHISCSIYTP